jgi:hypothetical protein
VRERRIWCIEKGASCTIRCDIGQNKRSGNVRIKPPGLHRRETHGRSDACNETMRDISQM